MSDDLKRRWKETPGHVRRPTVFIIGIFVILLSGTIGWLPGPGGIPLFLIGIAILATEFHWANRLKNFVLRIVYGIGNWYRRHRILGPLALLASIAWTGTILYMLFFVK